MSSCPVCHILNHEEIAFCERCGSPLAIAIPLAVASAPGATPQQLAGLGSICPQCGHRGLPGDPFCQHCGRMLAAIGSPARPGQGHGTTSQVALVIQPINVEVAVPQLPEVVIGRADPAEHCFPDVDLAPFDGRTLGVSRQHARLLMHGGQLLLEDLGTRNGTTVNRRLLHPRQPAPLRDGDRIEFGNLAARVRYHA